MTTNTTKLAYVKRILNKSIELGENNPRQLFSQFEFESVGYHPDIATFIPHACNFSVPMAKGLLVAIEKEVQRIRAGDEEETLSSILAQFPDEEKI